VKPYNRIMVDQQKRTSKQIVCLITILAIGLFAFYWKYFALVILLSLGPTAYKSAHFYHPCSHARDDTGMITVRLLDECGMPDKAMELVSTKAQMRMAEKWDEAALAPSFHMGCIDRAGTVPSRRWQELTGVYRNYLEQCLDKLERAETISISERDRFSWSYRQLGLNYIEGLENHKLNLQCLYYFERILAVSQKVNSRADQRTLLKLCEFYSRHPELKDGRDRTTKLVNQALEHNKDRRQCKDRLYRKRKTDGKGYRYCFMCPCKQTTQPDPRSGVVCQCVCYQKDKTGIYYCCCEHAGFELVSDGDYL